MEQEGNGLAGAREECPERNAPERALEGGGGIFAWEQKLVDLWPEPVDGALLLDELTAFIARYVVLMRYASETLALWVLHTYGFRLRDVTTYIGVESPQKRCGKTTLLTVLSELVERPVVASNISSPAFFRVIEEKRPTLMIDEADTVLHRNDELRGILNAGYKRKTAYVVRVANEGRGGGTSERGWNAGDGVGEAGSERAGRTRLARYSCWCPKVIATIRHLPETLADRCIVIEMHRKTPEEKCERLKDLGGGELRRKCARFVSDHAEAIARACPQIPAELNDRAADIWEPLLALSELAGGAWVERGRESARAITARAQEHSPIGALLFDILLCFVGSQAERLFSRSLVGTLNGLEDRPWWELKRAKQVTGAWLAGQLRAYGVRPKTIWIGEEAGKGYLKEDFEEVFQRYIPKAQAKLLLREFAERPVPEKTKGAVSAGNGNAPGVGQRAEVAEVGTGPQPCMTAREIIVEGDVPGASR
jgi:putative DNA primase/helicase